jgi:hypothetical protein
MASRDPGNPNLCSKCAGLARGEDDQSAGVIVSPEPLEHFLEAEGPSVLECFAAVEQANQALAEAAEKEKSVAKAPQKPQEIPIRPAA